MNSRMKHFEFEAQLGPNATIKLPDEFVDQIAAGQPLHVVVMLSDTEQDAIWGRLTAEQFLQGYAESDAIYDKLSEG